MTNKCVIITEIVKKLEYYEYSRI